jgi:hypothetical protein
MALSPTNAMEPNETTVLSPQTKDVAALQPPKQSTHQIACSKKNS